MSILGKEDMFLSARELGKKFGLNPMEMNHILKEQGFLSGKPGEYFPTDKATPYLIENFHHRGNGMGGAYDRNWLVRVYNDSILKELNISPTVIENSKKFCKQLRSEQRAAYLSRANTITPSMVTDAVKLSKPKVKGPKLAGLKSSTLLWGGVGVAVCGVGGYLVGKAIANREKKEEYISEQKNDKCFEYKKYIKKKKK